VTACAPPEALLAALLEPLSLCAVMSATATASRCWRCRRTESHAAGDVWDYFCESMQVPAGNAWIKEAQAYEKEILKRRG
jgi:L-rhamnose isomerase